MCRALPHPVFPLCFSPSHARPHRGQLPSRTSHMCLGPPSGHRSSCRVTRLLALLSQRCVSFK